MRWPFRTKSEPRSDAASPAVPAPVATAAVARPSGREWRALPPLEPTVGLAATTTDPGAFASSLALARPMVHAFEPRQRSSEGPSGTLTDAVTDRHAGSSGSEPVVLHHPTDLPPVRRRRAPVATSSPFESHPEPVHARSFEPEPAIETDPTLDAPIAPGVVDEPEPRRQSRPNLGQSRRLGLGAPVTRLPEDVVPQDIRDDIQAAFGVDVGDTVIRRDDEAARAARDADAAAFARDGREVVLPADLGPLDQPGVKGALAHELTHIAQQRLHGAGLPSEGSDAGRALEAAARAAEQRYRGDANAPSIEQSARDPQGQWLSTAMARRDADGELVFLPHPPGPGGMQRAPAATATPDYSWQTTWAQEHRPEAVPQPSRFALSEPTSAELDARGEALEQHLLPELVQFRADYRRDEVAGTGAAGVEEARRRFRELPAAQPAPETPPEVTEELSAQQRAALEEARTLHAQVAEAHERLEHERELVQRRNKAVEDVDQKFPLRNYEADTEAHTVPVPELPESARTAEERLSAMRTEHPELVHYFPVSTQHPEPSPHPTTAATGTHPAGPPASALTAHGSTAPTGTHTPGTHAPGAHAPGGTGGAAAHTALTLAGDVADISWEAGVFSTPSRAEQLGEATGLGSFSGFSLTEPTAEEREHNARLQEQEHLPALKARRAQRFHELAAAKADEVRREAFQHGQHVPAPAAAMALITTAEWQSIIDQVETEMPLSMHQLTDENRLIADLEHSGDLIPLVTNAPASREAAAGTPGHPATSATPATAATPAAAPSPATAATATTAAVHPAAAAPEAPVEHGAPVPAAHEGHHVAHTLLAAGAGALLGTGLAGLAERLPHDFGSRPLEEHEIDLSPELLNRLTTELYPKLRSRLRTELIVDRERAGVLPDFR